MFIKFCNPFAPPLTSNSRSSLGNHRTSVGSPHERSAMRNSYVSLENSPIKLINQQSSCWWFGTPCSSRDVTLMMFSGLKLLHEYDIHRGPFPQCGKCGNPLNTWRNNNVVITSKRRHFDVITSKWPFDVITTPLLRNVSAGKLQSRFERGLFLILHD